MCAHNGLLSCASGGTVWTAGIDGGCSWQGCSLCGQGLSLETDTFTWHGQGVDTNMFQLWLVEVEQPVACLTLAGRNNLLPVSIHS